jgi:putative SOS response-associated peptidase YedK
MCGRYRLSRRKQLVEEYFDTGSGEAEWDPRYNIAPTQLVPVIRQHPNPSHLAALGLATSLASWLLHSAGKTCYASSRSISFFM